MSFLRRAALLSLVFAGSTLLAQAAPAASASSFSGAVRPALAQVGEALNSINIRKWKAPNEVRSAAEEDVASIQRDLTGTLAGLLQSSDAEPGSIPAGFAVYRNVDALYDTLLRVVETAGLAAPDKETSALDSALSQLENARASLGDEIMSGTQAQQAELTKLRQVVATAAATPRTARTTVVDDGPAPEAAHRHHTTKKHTSATEADKAKEKTPAQSPQK